MAIQNAPLTANTHFLDCFEQLIDQKMSDANWRHQMRYGDEDNSNWFIVAQGTLSDFDKRVLKARYEAAGWFNVIVANSGENGERSVLMSIKLYEKPQTI